MKMNWKKLIDMENFCKQKTKFSKIVRFMQVKDISREVSQLFF